MKILYFTSTGNSLYVAKNIVSECYSIPKLIKEEQFNFEDDKIGIVFPTYHGGVPKIIEEFLNKVSFKSDYIFGVITYGAFSGGATRHLFNIGKKNKIHFSYINEILMVDNYLPMFDIEKELEKQPKKNIEKHLKIIVEDIMNGIKKVKSNSIVLEAMRLVMDKFYDNEFEKRFSVNDDCHSCKTCEKVCPVDNIKVNGKPFFSSNCQHCLACIHHCRKQAISIKKEKNKRRYLNENISLNEIIKSNN